MARKRNDAGESASYNLYVVMDLVRKHEPLSRADLVRRTGLVAQTVSNIVETLLNANLLIEERRSITGRGQPPLDLRINPVARYAVGVALAGRHMIGVLSDFAGEEIIRLEETLPSMHPDTVLPMVARLVDRLVAESGVPRELLLGLGLVMPGLTEAGSFGTLVRDHPWRDLWRGREFVAELSGMTGLPVLPDNDRTASALSERLSGRGRGVDNFLYVYFGAGIGAGFVFAGLPYRGRAGRAGEIGHMVVMQDGRPCGCGNRGCLERYASLQALQSALGGKPYDAEPVDTAQLAQAVSEGHPVALAWLDEAATHLRTAIVSIENMLDIETVILGGVIPDVILEALLARLLPLMPHTGAARIPPEERLLKAVVGRTAPARGAAALVVLQSTVPDFSLLAGAGQTRIRPGILGQRTVNSDKQTAVAAGAR